MEGGENSDTRGVGLFSQRGRRFDGDSAQFTGTDMGDRAGGLVHRRQQYQETDGEDESSSSSSGDGDDMDDDYEEDSGQEVALSERDEEALVQRALYRISKAQAQGKTDVKLSKRELAALDRQRQRMEEEERRRRKRKAQRVAVPLSQFEALARPTKPAHASRHAAADDADEASVYPPMGYFPPPSGSRSLHASSSRSSSGRGAPAEAAGPSNQDPFRYQTGGPRAPAAFPRRNGSGQSEASSLPRRGQYATRRPSSDETSEGSGSAEKSTSEPARSREEIVVEEDPEPETAAVRTRSSTKKSLSPVSKRKPVPASSSIGVRGKKK